MMKNFEKFAQHQWPTWAKRRGWIANDAMAHDNTAAGADDADRVVQLEKDKWIFQRKRKSHSSAATTPTVIHNTTINKQTNKQTQQKSFLTTRSRSQIDLVSRDCGSNPVE